jgi:hypothetical protein
MKVEIDGRPVNKDNQKPFFAIRLYPETNEEMGNIEWGINVCPIPTEIMKVCNGTGGKSFHYAIIFRKKEIGGKI